MTTTAPGGHGRRPGFLLHSKDLTALELNRVIAEAKRRGPTRVVVDRECQAVTPDKALLEFGIVPDVIFIREDGWTLGAPKQYELHAHMMWQEAWIKKIEV